MLAERLGGLLPPLDHDDMLRVASIASVAGDPRAAQPTFMPPFRAPHHTTSAQALVGGGTRPRPGEISLAHRGVLFLDELPEFGRAALEALREPLESGVARISRVHEQLTFPAEFILVGAMNPCFCGFRGDGTDRCQCTPYKLEQYRGRISGPLLDRFDLHVEVPRVPFTDIAEPSEQRESESLRTAVVAARRVQLTRGGRLNARLETRALWRAVTLGAPQRALLKRAAERWQLSARSSCPRAEGSANDRRSRRQRGGDDGARRRGSAAALPRPHVAGSAGKAEARAPRFGVAVGYNPARIQLGSTALRQHDQQFFDSFMLVIGILMGAAVGLFFLVRAISIDTQGLYITEDPTVQEAINERIKPVGRVLLMGDAELAAAAAAAVATPTPVATVMTGPQVYNAACIVCHQPPGTGGAPPVGDLAAWAPRIEQGTDTLYMHALAGLHRHEGLHAAEGRPRRSLRRRDQRGGRLSRGAVALAPRDRRSDARRLAGGIRDHSRP